MPLLSIKQDAKTEKYSQHVKSWALLCIRSRKQRVKLSANSSPQQRIDSPNDWQRFI